MAVERTYNIPLRREWLRVPKHRRAKRAVKAVRNFLTQHMKSDQIKIGKYLNEAVWDRGMKSPPHHIQVNVTKNDEGIVFAEIVGAPKEEKITEKTKAEKPKAEIPEAPAIVPEAKPVEGEVAKAEKKEKAKQEKSEKVIPQEPAQQQKTDEAKKPTVAKPKAAKKEHAEKKTKQKK